MSRVYHHRGWGKAEGWLGGYGVCGALMVQVAAALFSAVLCCAWGAGWRRPERAALWRPDPKKIEKRLGRLKGKAVERPNLSDTFQKVSRAKKTRNICLFSQNGSNRLLPSKRGVFQWSPRRAQLLEVGSLLNPGGDSGPRSRNRPRGSIWHAPPPPELRIVGASRSKPWQAVLGPS